MSQQRCSFRAVQRRCHCRRFTNGGNAPAWYVVTQAGYDLNVPQSLSRGIEIVRDYTDEQGKAVTQVTLGQKIKSI